MPKLFTVVKTTLNEANRGHCRNANNARFKGTTPVWQVIFDDCEIAQCKTKKRAEAMSEWANKNWTSGTVGDVEMAFDKSTAVATGRFSILGDRG